MSRSDLGTCVSRRVDRTRMASWALVLGVAGLALGCSVPPGDGDASVGDASAAVGVLQLGEGERSFRAIEDGDTLLLARGCQGSQHVWMTLRALDMDPRGMVVQLSLGRAGDGSPVTSDFRLRLSFTPEGTGTASQLTGLTLQVPMPESALGQDLVLRGRLEDRAGVVALSERRVQIAWGTQTCDI
jgi:hypothetical protein